MLFVNGTNDIHYVLDSYMKSYRLVPGEKRVRVEVKMAHGHQSGWAPAEIGRFIDSKCRGGEALLVVGKPVVEGDRVRVQCASAVPLERAELHYTVDGGLRSSREWQTVPASVEGLRVVAPLPPAEANTWYISVRDARGAMVSSEVEIRQ
jgi:hypothetical protein